MPPRSPAASIASAVAPGAPQKKRAIVRRSRSPPGSLEARKAADRLRDILSGRVGMPRGGADDLLAAVRENIEKLTQEADAKERASVYEAYGDLCVEHNHICGICTEPISPFATEPQSIRGCALACAHIRKYHLKCLMESEIHVCYASKFDDGVSSFDHDEYYKVKSDEGMWSPAARAAILVVMCPDCRALTKIVLPSFASVVVPHPRRSLAFAPCDKPSIVEGPPLPNLVIPAENEDVQDTESLEELGSYFETPPPSPPHFSPSSPGYVHESP